MVNIDTAYFENMCITKYKPNINHGCHLDSYDLNSEKGIEYTKILGQRLLTITGFITPTIVNFSKLNIKHYCNSGDIIYYKNCFNNTNKRDEMMIKSYSSYQLYGQDNTGMILFNIYVREKNKINNTVLRIYSDNSDNNNISIKTENEEIVCNLSSEELINMIYTRTLLENLNIPGFKLVNRAPIDYVSSTLSKIKNLKDNLTNQFLNPINLKKDYFMNEYNPVVVEDVISPEIHKIIDEYFKTNIKNGVYKFGDRQSKRYKIIDEIITRLLHLEFLPLIEKIVGRKMEATYTYISAYVKGADLPAHTDRSECEYTCSYIIGKPPDTTWNIYVDKEKQLEKYKGRQGYTPPKEQCIAVDCRENGLMIFNGTDHIHYREPLEHEYYNVVLLHYCVKKDINI